jgi:hypothetical protein
LLNEREFAVKISLAGSEATDDVNVGENVGALPNVNPRVAGRIPIFGRPPSSLFPEDTFFDPPNFKMSPVNQVRNDHCFITPFLRIILAYKAVSLVAITAYACSARS